MSCKYIMKLNNILRSPSNFFQNVEYVSKKLNKNIQEFYENINKHENFVLRYCLSIKVLMSRCIIVSISFQTQLCG